MGVTEGNPGMVDDYTNAGMAHHMDAFVTEMRETMRTLSADATLSYVGRGAAAQGQVRATVGHRGHLTDLAIDDRWATEVDNQTLIQSVKEAVCRAVDDVHRQIGPLPPATKNLEEMVEAFDRSLNEISNGLARVLSQDPAT
jgi:DNA-binding protein YbaB